MLAGHLVAVHARHHDVEQDEVGRLRGPRGRAPPRRWRRSSRRKPSGASMTSSSSRLWRSSSTIRTRAGRSAMSGIGVHAPDQLSRDGRQEVLVAHRLGDVAVAPGGANALLVALHRQGGEGDHRNGARRLVPLEQRGGLEAVHAGKLDVHQDQVGLLVARQRQPGLGVRRAEHGVARRLQQEDRQRHVGGVVLDDQDLGHVRPTAWRPGHGPPDFGREAVAVELGLFHDRRHVAVQLGAVLGGDLLGGDHQDRNAGRVGLFAERLHHVEAVHLRHHQIEHDQVRQLPPRGLDRLAAAVRAQHGAGQALACGRRSAPPPWDRRRRRGP